MFITFVGGLLVMIIGVLTLFVGKVFLNSKALGIAVGGLMIIVGLVIAVATTAFYVEDSQGGEVTAKFGPDLKSNAIIATNGEKGPQAYVLPPGWHFGYYPWYYDITQVNNMDIREGMVGVVLARDGKALSDGDVYAPKWDSPLEMLDGEKFLKTTGFKGPQLTVLPPGQYRYNSRLFSIQAQPALVVKVGKVVVVKADAGKEDTSEDLEKVNGVPMVQNGYRGIWKTALTPNQYYMHPDAYETIDVKVTNRIYSYTSSSRFGKSDRPDSDNSITVRTKDGFTFPVDVRVSVKITADDAPYVVALLGDPDADDNNDGFDRLEEIVILPAVRSIFRNSAEKYDALEYVGTRSEIEKDATEQLAKKLAEYHIETNGVFIAGIGLGDTPEGKILLKTQTDREVARQEKDTWAEKKLAEIARAESVKAQAEAEKEIDRVSAKVAIDLAEDNAQALIKEANGRAEAARMEIDAVGGFTNYMSLKIVEMTMEQWDGKVPETFVISGGSGDGNGLISAVMAKMIKDMAKKE